MPIASLKPLRKTAPSSAISTSVTGDLRARAGRGANGFSTMWAVASAAERVIVMTKSVATKPSRHEHEQLALPPGQQALEHRDRAVAVRALAGDPPVHRQRAEEREQHQDQRGDRRRARRRPARRCRAGSRASRSSRRRSGTSPATRGADAPGSPSYMVPLRFRGRSHAAASVPARSAPVPSALPLRPFPLSIPRPTAASSRPRRHHSMIARRRRARYLGRETRLFTLIARYGATRLI